YCPPPWCYFYCIFFSDAPTTEIYTLSLHDALPIYQRAGQERAHEVDLDGEAALDAAIDHTLDDFLFFEGLFEAGPGAGALGLLARQPGLARAVLDAVERDFHIIAHGDFDLAALVLELFDGDHSLALEAGVDQNHVGADFDHASGQDGAWLDLLRGQALFEQLRKTFGHECFRGAARPLLLAPSIPGPRGGWSSAAHPLRREKKLRPGGNGRSQSTQFTGKRAAASS